MTTWHSIPAKAPTANPSTPSRSPLPKMWSPAARSASTSTAPPATTAPATATAWWSGAASGFRHPPSYHTDQIRDLANGFIFDVITNGFGAMPDYAAQIPVRDRWAIVSYIRALQLSQNASVNDVPAEDRGKLGGAQ